jgi:MgtC family
LPGAAVGFLAGGAILRTGATVSGLTTAAGLWLVTAIGMCADSGMFIESVAVTLMGILALTSLRRFEDKNMLRRPLSIVLSEGADGVNAVVTALRSIGVRAQDMHYDKRLEDGKKRVQVTFEVEFADDVAVQKLIDAVESVSGVRRITLRALSGRAPGELGEVQAKHGALTAHAHHRDRTGCGTMKPYSPGLGGGQSHIAYTELAKTLDVFLAVACMPHDNPSSTALPTLPPTIEYSCGMADFLVSISINQS